MTGTVMFGGAPIKLTDFKLDITPVGNFNLELKGKQKYVNSIINYVI